jgi:regulator of protease activity HflC (stomatin/prohibitin superfamily)
MKIKVAGFSLSTVMITLFLFVFVIPTLYMSYYTVNQGHRGIHICWGARVNQTPVEPGLHLKKPWCGHTELSIRVQDMRLNNQSVKTKSGLNVQTDAYLRYRLKRRKTNWVYDNIGGNRAIGSKVQNTFQATLKEVASKYNDQEMKTKITEYSDDVTTQVRKALKKFGFSVDHVKINNVNFPKSVEQAIARKEEMEHEQELQERKIEVQEKKKQQRIVEAEGIARSMEIIQQRLAGQKGQRYLQHEFINKGLQKGDPIYVPMSNDGMSLYKDIDKVEGPSSNKRGQ